MSRSELHRLLCPTVDWNAANAGVPVSPAGIAALVADPSPGKAWPLSAYTLPGPQVSRRNNFVPAGGTVVAEVRSRSVPTNAERP